MKCFGSSRNCHFTLLLGWFLVRTPQKQPTFLTSDGKQDDVSDMLQFSEVFRNGLNWAKKWFFGLFYTLWDTSQNFAKYRTLLRYISEVIFISMAYAIVKWKILKVFCIDSVSMKCPLFCDFFAFTPPNIVRSCWNFDHR